MDLIYIYHNVRMDLIYLSLYFLPPPSLSYLPLFPLTQGDWWSWFRGSVPASITPASDGPLRPPLDGRPRPPLASWAIARRYARLRSLSSAFMWLGFVGGAWLLRAVLRACYARYHRGAVPAVVARH